MFTVWEALSHELNLSPRNLEVLVRAQAAVAARHVRSASLRRTRSVKRCILRSRLSVVR
jgi:hypothetical protein